jgi:hypothetical protein
LNVENTAEGAGAGEEKGLSTNLAGFKDKAAL